MAIHTFMANSKTPAAKIKKPNKNEYKIIKSIASDSLNYVSKRFGEIVTEEMADGWIPHGTPLVLIEDEKYILLQSMKKGLF